MMILTGNALLDFLCSAINKTIEYFYFDANQEKEEQQQPQPYLMYLNKDSILLLLS